MKKSNKFVSMFIIIAILLTLIPTEIVVAAATGDFTVEGSSSSYSYANNTLIVCGDDALTISGTTTADRILIGSGVNANITLTGVNIQPSSGCPFKIENGGKANITLKEGTENILIATATCNAGLQVNDGASVTIDGNGKLTAKGSWASAGIGGSADGNIYAEEPTTSKSGNITINSGIITAMGGYGAAGIGGGRAYSHGIYCGDGGTTVINGGTIYAYKNTASAAIGGGQYGDGGTIQINGGNIKVIEQGSYGGEQIGHGEYFTDSSTETIKNSKGQNVYRDIITLDGMFNSTLITNITTNSATYSTAGMYTVDTNKLYIYLPESNYVTSVTAGGVTYKYGKNVQVKSDNSASDTLYSSPKIYLNEINFIGSTFYLAKNGTHNQYSYDNKATWINCDEGITLSGKKNGINILVESGTHNITLDNVTIDSSVSGSTINITSGAIVNLNLKNGTTNTLSTLADVKPCIEVAGGAMLYINGNTGILNATARNSAAAIGGFKESSCGNITINGGVINAKGGGLAAGIGSGENRPCGTITINGGTVNATGGEYCPGIGCGNFGGGGTIIITGGTITSSANNGYGGNFAAIGRGGSLTNTAVANTAVYISGGNIKTNSMGVFDQPSVSSSDSRKVYKTEISLEAASSDTSISSLIAGYGLNDVKTIDTNKLYVYLPQGTFISQAKSDSRTYQYNSLTTSANNNNSVILYEREITIDKQPAAITNVLGGSITGNLSISGSILPDGEVSYQWYSCKDKSKNNSEKINGATNKTFTIPTDLSAGTHYFYCVLGCTGAESKMTDVATINVALIHVKSISVSGSLENFYELGVSRHISGIKGTTDIKELSDKNGDFSVLYYEVDENRDNQLVSTSPVTKAVSPGVYLYVIGLSSNASKVYTIDKAYNVTSVNLPENLTSLYNNVGYMTIKPSNPTQQQKPIYFDQSTISKYKTDQKFTNALTNENETTPTYSSTNVSVATVDANGEVSIVGVGTTTIKAISEKTGTSPVYASYTLNITKKQITVTAVDDITEYGKDWDKSTTVTYSESVTLSGTLDFVTNYKTGDSIGKYDITPTGLTSDDFEIVYKSARLTVTQKVLSVDDFIVSAFDKTYDGTKNATVMVKAKSLYGVDAVNVVASGTFADENVLDIAKEVTVKISGLTGAEAENYKLSSATLTMTTTAKIKPMKVEFVLGNLTFKYDGNEKSVDVSATDEQNKIFTGYTVKYLDKNNAVVTPANTGNYKVSITLNDNVNYATDYTDKVMSILAVDQQQINIVGVPGTPAYKDEFILEAIGGNGNGRFEWSSNNSDVIVTANRTDSSKATVKISGGIGEKVTITVKKLSDGNYDEKETKVVFVPIKKNVSFVLTDLEQEYNQSSKKITVVADDTEATYSVLYNGKSTLPTDSGTYSVAVYANGNYSGSATATLTISKATLSGLNVHQNNAKYGDVLPDATYDAAPEGVTVSVKYSTLNGQKPVNAGKYTVTATYSGKNYETYETHKEFVITKKELTVKGKNVSRSYGEANPVFVLEYSGFVNGEDENALLSEPIATVNANSSSSTGNYAIIVTGGRAENYSFNYDDSGIMTITGAKGGIFYITGANNNVLVGDSFKLRAYYDNILPSVKWSSNNESVATIDQNGNVTVHASGKAILKAEIDDANYAKGIIAEFALSADKKTVVLTATDTVKIYNGNVQGISLVSDNADFVPVLSGENKNVQVSYVLTTDSNVTEAKNAGTYTVRYSILDSNAKYKGNGTTTLYINKRNAVIKAVDVDKEYGEANPEFKITGLLDCDMQNKEYASRIRNMFVLSSDADEANQKADIGTYPITLSLKVGNSLDDDVNYNIVISDEKGSLTIHKAPLAIIVEDIARLFGEENSQPRYTYVGFLNGDTEDVLSAKPIYTYVSTLTKDTDIGTYQDAVTLSGADAKNYDITYSYVTGQGADVTIGKLPVILSAGISRSNYLTIVLDKAIMGLTKDHFKVALDNADVEITDVMSNSEGTQYTINGSFTEDVKYTVTVLASENYEFNVNPVSIIPVGEWINPFKDVSSNDWFVPYVEFVNKKGLMNGVKNNTFSPNVAITRGEFISILYKLENEPETELSVFEDVDQNKYYAKAIGWANSNGIVKGVSKNNFEPNEYITREQIATIIYRYAEYKNKVPTDTWAISLGYEDTADISGFATKAVMFVKMKNIMLGNENNKFEPKDNATRAEAAAVIQRIIINL